MTRQALITLEYQPLIEKPPVQPEAMYQMACANDKATIAHWKDIWLGNITANKSIFGSFGDKSMGVEYNRYRYGTAIIAGSGPSLRNNAHELKNRGGIPLVSCLHNFHYFEDLGVAPEYYVTLDAGPITIQEVYTGGSKSPEEYWELSKDRTLIAFSGSHPDLLRKWKGKILFFNAPIPDPEVVKKIDEVEVFNTFLSSGGNVLGACLYFAKAVLGVHSTVFIGADFSFGYDSKFYSWNDPTYDGKMGETIRCVDIYGIPVRTWGSYWGFKQYFDSVSYRLPGIYYNCTEGGCLGAYPQGNIASFKYLDLKDCLKLLNLNDEIKQTMLNPAHEPKMLLYS